MSKIVIYCAGSQGMVVSDILSRSLPDFEIYFIDDDLVGKIINNKKVYSLDDFLSNAEKTGLIIANGNPKIRESIFKQIKSCNFDLINVIDKSAIVMPSSHIGIDNVVAINAVVNSNTAIGSHCIINTGSIIEHDCKIDDFVTICPGVQIGGKSIIGYGSFICTGAIILPRIRIGKGSVIAAGSVVTKDIPDFSFVKGTPARVLHSVNGNFDWNKLL